MRIREINPTSENEIRLVAIRMRQTLVEVLGEERGTSLYSMEWLMDRVRWHLDPKLTAAKIFLTESEDEKITGHAIARIEHDADGEPYGYFSTIFVDTSYRNQGTATTLILHVQSWLETMKMPKIIYNTAENHSKLICLFERHGFHITNRQNEMVQLIKQI
jgi:GNAT superfamily N-acetyltransferase